MDTKKIVSLLETLNKQLDCSGPGTQKKASQSTPTSTAKAKAKVKELMQLNKKSRNSSTKIDAKKGYPSISSKR